jgi:hypothetical protein
MGTLYDTDFYGWALEQARAIRASGAARLNTLASVDWENIAEELEGLARSEAKELRSRYRRLLLHLLKWRFQPNDGRGAGSCRSARSATRSRSI